MLILALAVLSLSILSLVYCINSSANDIAKAIREQTEYFKQDNEDEDLDDGDDWKKLIKK